MGTRNRTGQPYMGHFNLELMNLLHSLLHATYPVVPDQDLMAGFINGWLYEPTAERLGIAPIPDRLKQEFGMAPYDFQQTHKMHHQFLARSQGTKYAVMPVCTDEEKKLYKHLRNTSADMQRNDYV